MRTFQARIKNNQLAIFKYVPILCIITIAYFSTEQFLKINALVKTPANDLATHVAAAENFYAAFMSGQFIPILQVPPFADIPDSPLFQYYGFMIGLVALPWMLISFPAITSLMLGIFFFRIAGAAGVYYVGRLLGGNRKASILASFVYIMSPYVISNLYGRVAVPESLAQCELPFLVLGILLTIKGHNFWGVLTIAITTLLLSLTHPIFLLYGFLALTLMMATSMSIRVIISGAAGLLSGALISAFHWYPILLSNHFFSARFAGTNPSYYKSLTSEKGLFGIPDSLYSILKKDNPLIQFDPNISNLYLTPSWFTLPAILGLILLILRNHKHPAMNMILIPNIFFLFLAFDILDVYDYLPHMLWNVQFPYRLLSFVALFTACALPLILPRLKFISFVGLIFLAAFQITTLCTNSYTEQLDLGPHLNSKIHANYNFNIVNKNAITDSNEMLLDYAENLLSDNSHALQPPLKRDNIISGNLKNAASKHYVRIEGNVSSKKPIIQVWLVNLRDRSIKSEIKQISPGDFSVIFALPKVNSNYILVTNPNIADEGSAADEGTTIRLRSVVGLPFHFVKLAGDDRVPSELRLNGKNISDQSLSLWFARPSDPDTPITGKIYIPPGKFSGVLRYPETEDEFMVVSSRLFNSDLFESSSFDKVYLSYGEIVPINKSKLPRITYEFIDTLKSQGYSREYSIRNSVWWTPNGETEKFGTVQLPTAYSPFFMFWQNNQLLSSRPDDKGRTNVETKDLSSIIEARYRIPLMSYVLTILGFISLIIFALFTLKKPKL